MSQVIDHFFFCPFCSYLRSRGSILYEYIIYIILPTWVLRSYLDYLIAPALPLVLGIIIEHRTLMMAVTRHSSSEARLSVQSTEYYLVSFLIV